MDNFKNFFNDFDSFFNDFDGIFNNKKMNFGTPLGKTKTEKGKDSNGEWVKQTFESVDGSIKMTHFYRTAGHTKAPKAGDPQIKIGDLKAKLDECVEKQEFEKAAELRDKIKALETNSQKIDELNAELKKAVDTQNFEKAIEIRDQLKKLQK